MSKEQKIRVATQWMIEIANDNSHGYSQSTRWGPSYDCSSLVIQAWEMAGVPVKTQGATYTGNIYSVFTRNGFTDVSNSINFSNGSGLEYGDICLNHSSHVVAYIGNGQIVHARSSEGTSDTVDNSGNEIRTQSYWNFPWDCILRYTKEDSDSSSKIEQKEEKTETTISVSAASSSISTIQAGDVVSIIGDTYYNGTPIPTWVKNHKWIVLSVFNDRAVINKSADGDLSIMSPINIKDIKKEEDSSISLNSEVVSESNSAINSQEYSKVYTVKNGDNLWSIAAKELGDGLRYREIKELNNLTIDTIYPGQKLELP